MDKTVARLERDLVAHSETAVARGLLGIDPPKQHPITEPIWLTELNDSQKDAIRFCLASDTVACIHGPPGTGKTHTLVELIYQLLSKSASIASDRPPRILVCTPSNLALDNILLRLYNLSGTEPFAKILPRSAIVRVGHPTRVYRDLVGVTLDYKTRTGDTGELVRDIGREIDSHLSNLSKKRGERGAIKGRERGKTWDEVRALRKDYKVRESRVVGEVVAGAQVVLATCHSAGSRMLANTQFDVCIIDEATQAVEPVCWVPIMKSKRVILAGDPKQLPPTIKSKAGSGKVKGTGKGVKEKAETLKGGGKKAVEPVNDLASDGIGEEDEAKEVSASDNGTNGASTSDAAVDDASAHTPASTPATTEREDAVQTPTTRSSADGSTPHLAGLTISANGSNGTPPAPPTNIKPHPKLFPRSLEETLFDRLERTYPTETIKRVLKVQYRMHADIASFPSDELYESALVSHDSVASHILRDILPPLEEQGPGGARDEDDLDIPPVVFYDTAGCEFFERSGSSDEAPIGKGGGGIDDESKSNANEAVICAKWARHLVALGLSPKDIGIVTPYQAQVSLLSGLLSELVQDGLTIGSVDGLQGQEREAIILSLVRSNPEGEIGFLGEYRRMNVGMTRAKRHLCIVGDSETVGKDKKGYLGKWMGWLEEHAEVRFAGDEA
jgi:DNA polymerase alpha-associated DNA helicase A